MRVYFITFIFSVSSVQIYITKLMSVGSFFSVPLLPLPCGKVGITEELVTEQEHQ